MKSDRWMDLEESLERLMPYYEIMNRIMSLGNDELIRRDGIDKLDDCDAYLDAGTGTGSMARRVMEKVKVKKAVLMDPSVYLLMMNKTEGERVQGLFENMPFCNRSFDLVTCAFSFRDAVSHEKAAGEISRVLKKGGRFLLVDIVKPDNLIMQLIFYLYIFIFPVFTSFFITRGKLVHEYYTLFYTYIEYPSEKMIREMFLKNGLRLVSEGKRFGGALFYQLWVRE